MKIKRCHRTAAWPCPPTLWARQGIPQPTAAFPKEYQPRKRCPPHAPETRGSLTFLTLETNTTGENASPASVARRQPVTIDLFSPSPYNFVRYRPMEYNSCSGESASQPLTFPPDAFFSSRQQPACPAALRVASEQPETSPLDNVGSSSFQSGVLFFQQR
ncbi:unnamed protein product [Ectocarpus sp. 12 AP-2014]